MMVDLAVVVLEQEEEDKYLLDTPDALVLQTEHNRPGFQ